MNKLCKLSLAVVTAFLPLSGGVASAQEAPPLSPLEPVIGERIARGIDACVTDRLDAAAVEASAVAADWPAFGEMGQAPNIWRASSIAIAQDSFAASLGVRAGAVAEAPSAQALYCKIIVHSGAAAIVSQRLIARLGGDGQGFFLLENGALRELTVAEMLPEFPQMVGALRPEQRLVVAITETRGSAAITNITVIHPPGSAQ